MLTGHLIKLMYPTLDDFSNDISIICGLFITSTTSAKEQDPDVCVCEQVDGFLRLMDAIITGKEKLPDNDGVERYFKNPVGALYLFSALIGEALVHNEQPSVDDAAQRAMILFLANASSTTLESGTKADLATDLFKKVLESFEEEYREYDEAESSGDDFEELNKNDTK